ncbi:MAG: alpha/beta hydrolase [Eubacteriales bacterium]
MKGTTIKRTGRKRKILIAAGIFLLVFILFPYMIPVSNADENQAVYPFEDSQFAVIDSVLLHYRIQVPQGNKVKGNVLLVHGLGGSTYSFNRNVSALAEAGYKVLSVDLPGFGYSSRSTIFDHSQLSRAKLLWKLIDQIEGPAAGKWFLAGHSMGGGTVTAMAYLNPGKTKSVILIDGALLDTNQGAAGILKIPPFDRYTTVYLEKILITKANIRKFLVSAYGREPSQEELQKYEEPLLLPGTAGSAIGFLKTSKNVPLEMLESLDVPFYGIWGKEDTWVPVDQALKIKEHIRNFVFVSIEGAYHCPMETKSEEFNKILITYLDSFE